MRVETRIFLEFEKNVTRLAGEDEGLALYNEQIKENLNLNGLNIIEFPEQIECLSISFVLGMTGQLMKIMTLEEFDKVIQFKGNEDVVFKIKKAMRY